MKKALCLLALTSAFFGSAQKYADGIAEMRQTERRSAQAALSVQVNPNTHNYDVTYQKLEFTVDPDQYYISGKVTTTFTALSNLSQLVLELANSLTVNSVKMGSADLVHSQNANQELVITLPSVVNAGSSSTVEVVYEGMPPFNNQAFSIGYHSGVPILYTLSEPFGARDWWPCKQDLNDKIDSVDIYITAPSQYTSVANGVEVSQTTSGGNKTTHFHHDYPITAYLVAIAVTNYSVFTQTAGTAPNDFPIVNYVYPEDQGWAQNMTAVTPGIMDFFEETFGTYPFSDEKYGHAQFAWGGGMEHQTVSFMGGFSTPLIAHELGHHWFGDKVTCGTWKDIWLNEGFASYMEGLYVEHNEGLESFVDWKAGTIDYICSQPGGAVYLTDAEALNSDRIFSGRLSYDKGAMVCEMLRWKLGDEDFFAGLQNYLNDPELAYGHAVTTDLQEHLEAASGQDLQEFFNDWLYHQGFPTYNISVENTAPGMAKFTVFQTQSHPSVSFFEMPVPVRIYGAGGPQADLVLDNTSNGQEFTVSVPFAVASVVFDPERHIISQDSFAELGVSEINLMSGISLYPNPATNQVQLSVPERFHVNEVVIANALGHSEITSDQTRIDVSRLSTGVHFLTVVTDSGKRTFKFIKQ